MNTGKACPPGVRLTLPPLCDGTFANGALDFPKTLERAEQDGADERERGECCQHVQPQGKVHDRPPSLLNMTTVYQSRRPNRSRLHIAARQTDLADWFNW